MPANTHIRDHEPMLPDTPPGRQLTAFLDALNSGDSTVMHRFMETCYDLSHLGSFMDAWHKWCGATLYHKTGGLQPQSIEESSVGKIVIRAQPRAPVCALPAGLHVTIEVAAEGPHKITDVWAWPDPPPADASVDIRGRRLAYTKRGMGHPTVVLEAGLGWASDAWAWVMDAVAQFTQVVSYDRAGLGASDPAPTPRTAEEVVADLHALLMRAAVAAPYVLVGHSFGGLSGRLYAHHYREDIVGMVLVDSSHPDRGGERELSLLPPATPTEPEALKELRQWLTRDKKVPDKNPEHIDWPRSEAQVRTTGPLGDRPLVVVSAGTSTWDWTGLPLDLAAQLDAVEHDLQRDLLRLSSRSTHIIADKSGHNVQFDQPELVVDAIHQVVEAVREGKGGHQE